MKNNEFDKLIERANRAMGKEVAAPLTTEQRKKLKKSTFCGPNRSFPINDCSHYTAGLRLLNRSKFSDSTKAKIKSCIIAKGKKMGCGGAKEKSSFTEQEINYIINSEIFKTTLDLVEASIKNPGMDLDFNKEKPCKDCV